MAVLNKGTNVDDNLPRCFDYFMVSDLKVKYQSVGLKMVPRCRVLTSNLLTPVINAWIVSETLSLSNFARSVAPLNASY